MLKYRGKENRISKNKQCKPFNTDEITALNSNDNVKNENFVGWIKFTFSKTVNLLIFAHSKDNFTRKTLRTHFIS